MSGEEKHAFCKTQYISLILPVISKTQFNYKVRDDMKDWLI